MTGPSSPERNSDPPSTERESREYPREGATGRGSTRVDGTAKSPETTDETTVPDADHGTGPPTCGYCDREFETDQLLALHWGHRHDQRLSATERAAYRAAHERESATLRRYRIKALAALVIAYFGFLFAFAIFG